jgi:hypothetical protein
MYLDYVGTVPTGCRYRPSLRTTGTWSRKQRSPVMNRITCPHFAIEFKKTDATFGQAWNEVVAASALALYNRYLLRKTRLEALNKPWTDDDSQMLQHCALIFTSATSTIWIVTPKISPKSGFDSAWDWAGCDASELWESNCATPHGVGILSTGIHRWGLRVTGNRAKMISK